MILSSGGYYLILIEHQNKPSMIYDDQSEDVFVLVNHDMEFQSKGMHIMCMFIDIMLCFIFKLPSQTH